MHRITQTSWRVISSVLVLSFLLLLTACDGGDIEPHNQPLSVLDDVTLEGQNSNVIALTLADWTGVSADGDTVRVDIDYQGELPAQWFEKSIMLLRVQLQPLESDTAYSAHSIELPAGQVSGSINMSVPTSNEPFAIVADLYQPRTKRVLAKTRSVAALNIDLLAEPDSSLAPGAQLVPEIVPQSYTQQQVGQRMIHRFAVRVYDAEEHVPGRKTLPGLGVEPERYFTALENGVPDVESPISVDTRRQRLQVYFILDASYSIVLAEAEATLTRSASRSVMALNSVADYDYRQFSGYIRSLDQIDDVLFDDATSATALYYALDTTLQDIENHADPLAHKIVVAFTDGRDYASLNRYADISTDEAMLQYTTELIRQAREREALEGGGLELHIVSVGDADVDALNRLANSGAGVHLSAGQWSGVSNAFEDVTRHVLSTYFLEYSSQRTTQPTELELEVNVGGAQTTIPVK